MISADVMFAGLPDHYDSGYIKMNTNPKWPQQKDNFNVVIGGVIFVLLLFFLLVPKLVTGV